MTMQQAVVLALQASILLTVFGFGLQTTLHDLQYLMRRPGLLARSLLSMFVIMPVVAIVLVRAFELRPSFEIALVALAISPVPPLLPGKEGKAGGHAAYGLALMAVVSVLAIVLVPLWLTLLAYFRSDAADAAERDRQDRRGDDAVAARRRSASCARSSPTLAARIEKPIKLVATVLLAAGAGALLIAALPVIAQSDRRRHPAGERPVRRDRAGRRALARRPGARRLDRAGAVYGQPSPRDRAGHREDQLSQRAAPGRHDPALPDRAHRSDRAVREATAPTAGHAGLARVKDGRASTTSRRCSAGSSSRRSQLRGSGPFFKIEMLNCRV